MNKGQNLDFFFIYKVNVDVRNKYFAILGEIT